MFTLKFWFDSHLLLILYFFLNKNLLLIHLIVGSVTFLQVSFGIAIGIAVRVGNFLGAGLPQYAKHSVKAGFLVSGNAVILSFLRGKHLHFCCSNVLIIVRLKIRFCKMRIKLFLPCSYKYFMLW